MTNYRRATDGKTYFFTVVTDGRRNFLCDEVSRKALKAAIAEARIKRPFTIDAWVLLPNHLHCIWTLPDGDNDFSARWSMIKSRFSKMVKGNVGGSPKSDSAVSKREAGVWQRRFWEHRIRDEGDFRAHLDYVHYNPVKHGFVTAPSDWPYSTFHRLVDAGIYGRGWGGGEVAAFSIAGDGWD